MPDSLIISTNEQSITSQTKTDTVSVDSSASVGGESKSSFFGDCKQWMGKKYDKYIFDSSTTFQIDLTGSLDPKKKDCELREVNKITGVSGSFKSFSFNGFTLQSFPEKSAVKTIKNTTKRKLIRKYYATKNKMEFLKTVIPLLIQYTEFELQAVKDGNNEKAGLGAAAAVVGLGLVSGSATITGNLDQVEKIAGKAEKAIPAVTGIYNSYTAVKDHLNEEEKLNKQNKKDESIKNETPEQTKKRHEEEDKKAREDAEKNRAEAEKKSADRTRDQRRAEHGLVVMGTVKKMIGNIGEISKTMDDIVAHFKDEDKIRDEYFKSFVEYDNWRSQIDLGDTFVHIKAQDKKDDQIEHFSSSIKLEKNKAIMESITDDLRETLGSLTLKPNEFQLKTEDKSRKSVNFQATKSSDVSLEAKGDIKLSANDENQIFSLDKKKISADIGESSLRLKESQALLHSEKTAVSGTEVKIDGQKIALSGTDLVFDIKSSISLKMGGVTFTMTPAGMKLAPGPGLLQLGA